MGADIEVKELPPQRVVSIRERTTAKGLGAAMRALYPVLTAYLEKQGARPAGPPFAVYHTYAEDDVDFETGYPVAAPVEGEGRIRVGELPGGPAAVARHVGPYTTIGRVHDALEAFVMEQGRERSGAPREVYRSGPADQDDSSRWVTDVIHPLR
jgi:effector-binding domain-containing protein